MCIDLDLFIVCYIFNVLVLDVFVHLVNWSLRYHSDLTNVQQPHSAHADADVKKSVNVDVIVTYTSASFFTSTSTSKQVSE